jgi:rRNA-processing protein FCF1
MQYPKRFLSHSSKLFSSLEAFWQQKILITKTVTQKLTMLRIKIFANFRQLFYGKPNYSGGY